MINLVAPLVALLLVVSGQAAKPNFSGNWKMNAAKSTFGVLPPPDSIVRAITHTEPSLTIVEDQRSPMGDQRATRKYITDGTPTTFEVMSATVNGSASWSEATLVVNSKVDSFGLTYVDRMSLSADGKTLTSQVKLSSPQGEVDLTVVFEKQ